MKRYKPLLLKNNTIKCLCEYRNEEHPNGEYVKYSDMDNALKVIKNLMNSLPPEIAMSKRQLKAFNGAKGFFGGINSK